MLSPMDVQVDEPGALAGLRVVDLSSTFMGPYCTRLLSQWGASVIKVEPPQGDVIRGIGDVHGLGLGPIFVHTNTGKRSICLDLKEPGGRTVLDRLIVESDVLVHNMRDRALRNLRLTGAEVLKTNPRIIYCGFRGYGANGPYANRPAYDDVIQAASGLARLEGGSGEPRYARHAVADKIVGVYGAAAVLAALAGRGISDSGRAIEVPMFETMSAFMLLDQQGGLIADPPDGPSGYPRTSSPYRRPYRTADGFLAVMLYTDAQWHSFLGLVGKSKLADDPRLKDIRSRTENIDVLYKLVESELPMRSTSSWLETLEASGIPCGPVMAIDDLFSDPHLVQSQFFRAFEHPVLGLLRLPRSPVPVGAENLQPAPTLGQHTTEILEELGYRPEEASRLTALSADRMAISVTGDTN